MTEQQIQNRLIKVYEGKGYFVLKLSKTNKNGIPDLLAIPNARDLNKGHRVTFIEVKDEDGTLEPLQEFRIRELKERYGFNAFSTRTYKRFYCEQMVQCSEQCSNCFEYIERLYD